MERTENEIAEMVVDAAFTVHKALGPGLFESVYEAVLAHEIEKRGLMVERQVSFPLEYDGVRLNESFRADLVVEGKVILEIKSVEQDAPVHRKQLLTYLKVSGLRLGLLINFGARLIKDGVTRLVNRLET